MGIGRTPRRLFASYGLAGGLALAALGLSHVIWPLIEATSSPLLLAAVVTSAWYGGFGPGLLTTAIAASGKAYFFMLPTSLRVEDTAAILRLGLFVVIAFLISSLTGALRRTLRENAGLIGQERAARADAEAANRAKDVFLATVSHELRTPIQAISSWLAVVRRRAEAKEDVGAALEAIDRSLVTQARLVEDLLDVARIVAGRLDLDIARVDPRSVIEAAIATARAGAPTSDVVMRIDLDPMAGVILGDRPRLEQVVCNLVSNALKFTPPEGRIDVRLRRAGETVRITVADTGCGIPADVLPHIFDEFRQGRRHPAISKCGGLGLGLAIVRQLVELHGGQVSARSDGPGRGAVFAVDLPAAGPALSAVPQEAVSALNRRSPLSRARCAALRIVVGARRCLDRKK